ncbi:conserved hypothetical protein [Gloeothece citriformis PCC 7424]|uniref:DUF1997 domain-containing protein n=1 Tax=Gloeothece citriformis (strain PCC 7424) TaxID=65393 RepID=B7K830_GLOC7|nr:DUF1997 domain-containing protein [Gloeothece citriformis]ACK68518.1 conserved hypothetical protein [Gloeothece citriformis PCC 7424]
MEIRFTASESVEIAVEDQTIPIQHYLRQPQRLVKAIANPKLTEQLSESLFRLKMRPLNFMDIYHFQPTVELKVWADANGRVYILSQGCEIRGIEYINDRFSLRVKGILSPEQKNGKTYLQGQADLEVKVELPPALRLTPQPLLEVAGNGLLKSVLVRIKQRLLSQLLADYRHWALNEQVSQTGQVKEALT